jgi:NTP pyrophosphatase (non-canonical NTP hydrolase)
MPNLEGIQRKIIAFRNERDWAQFHDSNNLAEALSIETGEQLENFLWKTTEQSRNLTAEELADIFIFLTYISEEYKIDLLKEVENKIRINVAKYPVEKAKGSNQKYNDLSGPYAHTADTYSQPSWSA